jgi:DNA polymerase (family X)
MKQTKLFGDESEVCDEVPLEIAKALAEEVLNYISPFLNPVAVVGSIRRKKPFVKDIDIVGFGSLPDSVRALCKAFKTDFKVEGDRVTKLYVEAECGKVQVDLYCAKPQTFGIHKLIRTGSAEHNMWLANYAMQRCFRLKYSDGLLKDGKVVAGETEEGVFEALGLPCPKPEEREIVNRKPVWQTTISE